MGKNVGGHDIISFSGLKALKVIQTTGTITSSASTSKMTRTGISQIFSFILFSALGDMFYSSLFILRYINTVTAMMITNKITDIADAYPMLDAEEKARE